MKSITLFCILSFTCSFVNAQISWDNHFANYLLKNEKRIEFDCYLNSFNQQLDLDSANFWRAKYYSVFFDQELFMHYFTLSKSIASADSDLVFRSDINFLRADRKSRQAWFDQIGTEPRFPRHETILAQIRKVNEVPILWQKTEPAFQTSLKQYSEVRDKTAWGAIWRSAILPGWGRNYVGRKGSAKSVFVSIAFLGVMAFESVKVLGIKHPYTWFVTSAFSVFYLGEIYGNAYFLNDIKEERLTQYYHDCADYYSFFLPH